MWTTSDGNVLHLPPSVRREMAEQSGMSEGEIMHQMGRIAGNSRRIGSFRARKIGRTFPVFKARSGPRSFGIVTKPLRGTRDWPGARGPWSPWGGAYGVIGVSSRFADPYDDDPSVPDDDDPPRERAAPRPGSRPGPRSAAALAWRGPLPLPAAARLDGGGIYIIEDANGQPAYVGQTASFARRLTRLHQRFPAHRVRVARIVPPPVDVLRAVGDALLRATRGAPAAPGPVRNVLPAGHGYGSAPARGRALRIERAVRRVEVLNRRTAS